MTKTLATTRHLSLFEIDNNGKPYIVASRQPNYDPKKTSIDAVTMFVLSEDGEKMLIVHEYRPAVGRVVISTPAGLVDPLERPEVAAVRELREETGFDDVTVLRTLPATYSSVGMTNELVQPVIIKLKSDHNVGQTLGDIEKIAYEWVDKATAFELATTNPHLTARAQLAFLLFSAGHLG